VTKKYDHHSHVLKVKRHHAVEVWLVHWQNDIAARFYDPIWQAKLRSLFSGKLLIFSNQTKTWLPAI